LLNKLNELISEGNISLGQLSIIFAVILTITAIIGYTFLFWEQRSYEKLLTGKPLPSNRTLKRITKDIEIGQVFKIEKVNGDWVAFTKDKKDGQRK
jgi:hypothetical protein